MKRILSRILSIFLIVFFLLVFYNLTETEAAYSPYSITVNCGSNVVTIYKDGSPYKSMICSTGSATPKSGTYSLNYKYRWLALFGGVYGQYCTRITGHILFHSVPYLVNGDPSSLEYWEYDKLGTSASAGCIRLTVEDAKWIYENCTSGTKVTFLNNSDIGPLGKPTSMKISNSANQNWDPTDPDSRNPWRAILSSPAFNTSFNYRYYADRYSDLKATFGYNEVLLKSHWISYGVKEGRQASPVLDVVYYASNNSDLVNAFGYNYDAIYNHYLTFGYNEGRRTSSEFYVTFYKNFYADLNSMSNLDAEMHYINFGKNEGRLGGISNEFEKAVFNSTYYANKYSDLKSTFGYNYESLKEHWFRFGIKEGREATPTFNVVEYMNYNTDLKKEYGNTNFSAGFVHLVRFGMDEGRRTTAKFNVTIYKSRYDDLQKAFGNNNILYYDHYINFGLKEGRGAI